MTGRHPAHHILILQSRPPSGPQAATQPPGTPDRDPRDDNHRFAAAMAQGRRPDPFRTRKRRPGTAMVLHSTGCGRVARRRTNTPRRGRDATRRPSPSSYTQNTHPVSGHHAHSLTRGSRSPHLRNDTTRHTNPQQHNNNYHPSRDRDRLFSRQTFTMFAHDTITRVCEISEVRLDCSYILSILHGLGQRAYMAVDNSVVKENS